MPLSYFATQSTEKSLVVSLYMTCSTKFNWRTRRPFFYSSVKDP